MLGPLNAGPLRGPLVHLLPLSLDHVEPLLRAASEGRESYGHTFVPDNLEDMRRWVEAALASSAAGAAIPFATIDAGSGAVVGATRFATLEWFIVPVPGLPNASPSCVEIGWTWLSHSAQHTHINTAAKLLMLRHAFGEWKLPRVMLKTAESNARSRAAIARLGARFDGVMTTWLPLARQRPSAFYSLLASEWPANEARLVARLSRG